MKPRARRAVTVALLVLSLVWNAWAPPIAAQSSTPGPKEVSESAERISAAALSRSSYTVAWAAIAAGVVMTGASFVFAHRADRAYADYLAGSDPLVLESEYDRAVRYDRWASATLLVGQGALAFGIYWRLVHRPRVQTNPGSMGLGPESSPLESMAKSSLQVIADPVRARLGVAVSF